MSSVALVLPYWGRFPGYFQFFLESVRRNPAIDVHVFTDSKCDFAWPDNAHIHLMPFRQFKANMQEHYDFQLEHLQNPYNLCDFKPTYGYCLQEYLQGYDFWGHCDCDLIFGDFRSFFTDELLSKYDRFLTRGHLTLYRNNEGTNKSFMEICPEEKNYKRVFQSSSKLVWAWDEYGGLSLYWKEKLKDRLYDEIIFDDLNADRKHFIANQRYDDDCMNGKTNLCYLYKDGALNRVSVRNGDSLVIEPTLYAHFQKRRLFNKCNTGDYNKYLIVPNSIIDYEDITVAKVKMWGRRRLFYFSSLKRRSGNLLRKVKRWFNPVVG